VRPILITGSAGFIGSHLRAAVAERTITLDKTVPADFIADIRDVGALQRIAADIQTKAVIHLAALCEVVTPWEDVGDLLSTNVDGTYNVLRAFRPPLFLFASSSSVYGSGVPPKTSPSVRAVSPLSAYGASKATGEVLCNLAAHEYQTAAVSLRLANVVGPGCRGLIPYLLDHASQYPDGSQSVRLRGGGRLVRDYVPVAWVVRALLASVTRHWEPRLHIFNVSSGIPMTNGAVFEIVRAALGRRGVRLNAEWSSSAAFGEAEHIVLDPETLVNGLGIEPPKESEVLNALEAAVDTSFVEPGVTAVLSVRAGTIPKE
jgi:nucleoside-diphosphate-sugar epimerase